VFIAAIVLSVLLAVVLIPSALAKLSRDERQISGISALGFPSNRIWLLAVAEVAGTVGLGVGLLWWPLGVAAAVGLIGYFAGAVGYLLRAQVRRPPVLASAIAPLLVAIAVVVLRLTTR
jgi:hypothetical protein